MTEAEKAAWAEYDAACIDMIDAGYHWDLPRLTVARRRLHKATTRLAELGFEDAP